MSRFIVIFKLFVVCESQEWLSVKEYSVFQSQRKIIVVKP